MSQMLLLLISFQTLMGLAMGSEGAAPAQIPSQIASAPTTRKLGKHQPEKLAKPINSISPAPSPEGSGAFTASINGGIAGSEGQQIHLEESHHSSVDKSVAGGGVILGGLATTFLVAVFCYIRATGRHRSDAHSHGSAATEASSC